MEAQAKYESTEIAPLGIIEITEGNLALMKKQILEIPAMPENKEQYITAKDMHIQAKKILPRIETRRKEIKAPHLEKCREIDATAKTAKKMIEPIIEMAGDRRGAWEAEIEAQKEVERKAEEFRLAGIMESIENLKNMINETMVYGVSSSEIKGKIFEIASYPMTEELFQEHLATAATIQATGLDNAKTALENRLKFESEQAELEAQQKAQAEAQAKMEAEQKLESERLAKVAAEQKAMADKAKADQEAAAQKLAKEKAAFEAEKKAMAKAEADRVEAARIAERDRLWDEAMPIHIWEHIYPVALGMNAEITQARRDAMDTLARRNMDLIRNRNAVDAMGRNVIDAIEMGRQGVDVEEVEKLVLAFNNDVDALIFDLNLAVSEVK